MKYEILEEFETTAGTTWQKRKYSSGKIRYRNSKDFRVNRSKQSWASASKHKKETTNEQIGSERKREEIFTDNFQHRTIQPTDFYGEYIDRMEEWYMPEPEVPIQAWIADIDNHIEKLENKIQKTGKDEPGWPDKFNRYNYFVKYYVIRDGEIFDTSRRYTKVLDSLEELELDFKGTMKELADIASGYDNILVIEYGIQGKVIG